MEKMKTVAIVLAAGQGRRMQTDIPKQYLLLQGKPVLYYTLKSFEQSPVDEIMITAGKTDLKYVQHEIVDKYNFQKVSKIVEGGKERYHSVHLALQEIVAADYVLIHDGARPFVTEDIIRRMMEELSEHPAVIAGMPVKDTIKTVNDKRQVIDTPDRSSLWQIQTPQAFWFAPIKRAYEEIMQWENIAVTDDAMVWESVMDCHLAQGYTKENDTVFGQRLGDKVLLTEGSYENIKITTPEDMLFGESLLRNRDG